MDAPSTSLVNLSVQAGADLSEHGMNPEGVPILVSIVPTDGDNHSRTPCDICCVVDVSGSMGEEAMLKSETGDMTGHGLSLLDIVKHALKTIIRSLDEGDSLALVAYSDAARTVFDLTVMDQAGREQTEALLDDLTPAGLTNLWDGLKTGYELLKSKHQEGRLQHIMLFTDGIPNISPPRGILPMLARLKQKEGGELPCTINTFGFGYELDSDLLYGLATEGFGTYAFIPDAGFVGTVFVNAVSNLLASTASNAKLHLRPQNGAMFAGSSVMGGYPTKPDGDALEISLGSVQFGQTRDIVVNMCVPPSAGPEGFLEVTLRCTTTQGKATVPAKGVSSGPPNEEEQLMVEKQRCRLLFVDGVREAMQSLKLTPAARMAGKALPVDVAQDRVEAVVAALNESPAEPEIAMKALIEDLQGQVVEAFSREDWYTKWGVHYLKSLICAHLMQQCNNFKDAGVQTYGGRAFEAIRDSAEEAFCKIPAPKPSAKPTPPPAASANVAAPRSAPAPVSMSAYYDRYAGCIDGRCLVRMADGSDLALAEVRKGDKVALQDGREGSAMVTCVVRTPVYERSCPMAELCDGLRITPFHPVLVDGTWRFPADLAPTVEVDCHEMITLVLDEGAPGMIVAGVYCASLGHGIKEGAAQHSFFGSRQRVIEDLSNFPGFSAGDVELLPGTVVRDVQTGHVCAFRVPTDPAH